MRVANLYGTTTRNVTPYGMTVEDNIAADLIAKLEVSSRYRERREAIAQWNRANPVIKRGIALTPVKFGISFTATHYNQAGALLHLYNDGTLLLNHGGTEMGQGLFTKVAQVVAQELGVPLATVRVSASDTSKVPNASPTAASSGSDLNGMAARDAARTLRERLAAFAARKFDCDAGVVAVRRRHGDRRPARRCRSPSSRAPRTSRACSCRRPASTPRRRSTTTARRSPAGRSSTSRTARRCRRWRSTR